MLDIDIEMAAPDDFVPALPGWRERSQFIASSGPIEFRHYDFYGQALAKIERGHKQDIADVQSMLARQLIDGPLSVNPGELDSISRYRPRCSIGKATKRLAQITAKHSKGRIKWMIGQKSFRARTSYTPVSTELARGEGSAEALLVAIGSPRLRRLGFRLPENAELPEHPELLLYRLLCEQYGKAAHSQYNALIRRLVSFERAAEFRQARLAREGHTTS